MHVCSFDSILYQRSCSFLRHCSVVARSCLSCCECNLKCERHCQASVGTKTKRATTITKVVSRLLLVVLCECGHLPLSVRLLFLSPSWSNGLPTPRSNNFSHDVTASAFGVHHAVLSMRQPNKQGQSYGSVRVRYIAATYNEWTVSSTPVESPIWSTTCQSCLLSLL